MVLSLLERSHSQNVDFLLCKESPVASTEILLGKTSKLDTVELDDTIAEALEDATHDTVLAAVDLDAYLALVGITCVCYSIGMYLTIAELNAFADLLDVVSCHVLVKEDVVYLLLEELRMCELACKVAIIGQEEHASGVTVEAANRVDTLRTYILHKIHYGLALLWVIACGDISLGLVKQYINFLLDGNRCAVDDNLIATQHLNSEFGHYLTIDRHSSILYELICLTSTAYTCIGNKLIQAQWLVGIDMFLLVLDALLHAILSIGIIVGTTLTIAPTAVVITTTIIVVAATQLVATLGVVISRTIATLLLTGLIAALLVAIVVIARTIAALVLNHVLAIAIVITWTIALLLTWLIASFALIVIAWTIAALLTRLVTLLTGLIAALALIVIARTITALLTRLVPLLTGLISALALIVIAWTIARIIVFRTCALAVIIHSITAIILRSLHMDTWTHDAFSLTCVSLFPVSSLVLFHLRRAFTVRLIHFCLVL